MQVAKVNNAIRNIVLSVIALAAVSLLAHSFGAEPATSTAPKRNYYLTPGTFNGNEALTACKSGYHFASSAELSDSTAITYNSTLGRSQADDGAGPPTVAFGWVRSGYISNSSPTSGSETNIPTNCNLWTSASGSDDGEMGAFGPGTTGIEAFDFGACNNSNGYNIGVWCVQN
jgi:hypothetical protein